NVIMGDITLKARWTLDDEFFAVKQNASVRAEDTTIRAMSFNILCDDYNNKPAVAPRVPGVVNTILRYMPDVIGLQECDDQWYAALAADSSLSAKFKFINYDSTAQNKVTYGSTKYTNYSTIMYNKDVLELVEWTQQLHNPPCGNYNCRVFTIAVFRIKQSGKLFIFTSTHLALSVDERVDQVNNMKSVIDQWKAKYPDVPFMMSGDYNANESEISIINLMSQNDLFDSKNAKVKGTVCRTGHISNGMLTVSRDPAIPSHWILGRASVTSKNLTTIECIDHILLSNGVESLYYDTIHDSEALDTSDHMPIYCDVKF
ncbi:MAG: endonuclease/exonuclease/phosphatase family protein, partial [Clostridia bacterium]|nr:endonuclease/exonuclease/phosphatase family protein [Clostridia bacterium]